MEETIKHWTFQLSFIIEAIAGVIIAYATLQATWRVILTMLRPSSASVRSREEVRLHLARWLAVALEFELAADILRTAVAPTWDEIGKLAAIAALRTLLNHFLDREIRKEIQEEAKKTREVEKER
ncbi:DUF1622 domain-containing protein [Deinococcus cellulosilyticus]|nr:DUF1622 domain-containing protein [Deinococcus cellulosilyticus]